MTEEWRDIEGYEGSYSVSNLGRVKSLKRPWRKKDRILNPSTDNYGYPIVSIKGKTKTVHRLVAKAFIPNPLNLPEVNHKDEVKTNNKAENLEWCTTQYNLTYGSRLDCARGERNEKHKLTATDVLEIRRTYVKGDREYGQSALAKRYGVKHPSIAAIVNRTSWKHLKEE